VANGDIFRLTLEGAYTAESIAVQHVLWFRQESVLPVVDEAEWLLTEFGENVLQDTPAAPLLDVQASGFQWLNLRCQKMLDPFEEPVGAAVPTIITGNGLDDAIPGGVRAIPSVCSLVAKLISERAGRSGLGRIYFGGFANRAGATGAQFANLRDHGRWSGNCVSQIQAFLHNLLVRYDGATDLSPPDGIRFTWGVWSRKFGNQTPPHNPAGFSPMAGVLAQEVVRLQRRREYGVGQ
jgi:hypothetical protein